MNALLKKLNFKAQEKLTIINAPDSLEDEIADFAKYLGIEKNASEQNIEFLMVFCTKLVEVEKAAELVAKLAEKDALLWLCYPKGTSKKYKCEFNRDNGWAALGALGYEPVRMVAIDDDWSGLRFKKNEDIKTMTRNQDMRLSDAAKNRT